MTDMPKTISIEEAVAVLVKAFQYSGTMDEDTWHIELARLAIRALKKHGYDMNDRKKT